MKGRAIITIMMMLILASIAIFAVPAQCGTIMNYGDVNLSGGYQANHFNDVWDLTKGDLTISFTYNANGLADNSGAHAWAELGIRSSGSGDFNPDNYGVWLSTDYDSTANTFDPDPVSGPILDLDDKMILQTVGGHGEGSYNLPSAPPTPGNNHNFWFDRDGVDASQALSPLAVNGGTYNTEGIYHIVITLHATSATTGTAYMTINGLNQGFETDGNWNTMELSPAGITFTGDMTQMLVFYGLYGYGATHSMSFQNINVSGSIFQLAQTVPEVPYGAILASALMIGAFGCYFGMRRNRKPITTFKN
jgi:hypothetical protein